MTIQEQTIFEKVAFFSVLVFALYLCCVSLKSSILLNRCPHLWKRTPSVAAKRWFRQAEKTTNEIVSEWRNACGSRSSIQNKCVWNTAEGNVSVGGAVCSMSLSLLSTRRNREEHFNALIHWFVPLSHFRITTCPQCLQQRNPAGSYSHMIKYLSYIHFFNQTLVLGSQFEYLQQGAARVSMTC